MLGLVNDWVELGSEERMWKPSLRMCLSLGRLGYLSLVRSEETFCKDEFEFSEV